jgi:PAS domain S-box-containing protein/putative nucleotidyltransferase with HDIG domain
MVKQTLRDSELRYRRLFEAAQDGILILNAETGAIKDVNPYLINMLGYSREEFVEKKLWEVGAFKDIGASREAFEALKQNEYIRYENLPLKAKGGRLIQVEFVSNVYFAGVEKVIQCNIRDITEHKRIIVALEQSEKKYHDFVNQSPDGIFIMELSGKILTVNKAMCTGLEYSEEEFLSMNIWDIIPEEYLDKYKKRLTRILEGESFEEMGEYAVRGKSGKIHYVEVLSAPHYSGKHIIGFQGIARDITQRKQVEEALRESERHYRQIIETAGEGIWAIDADNRTTLANQHLADMLGYTVKEMLGKSIYDFMDEEGKVIAATSLENRQQGINEQLDFKYIHKNGSTVWAIIETSTLLDHNQQYIGALAMLTDITRRKQIEEEMRQRLSELEVLYQSGLAFNQLIDPKTIAEKIIDLLDQEMDWHHTAVRLYHAESATLELLAFHAPNLNTRAERSAAEERLKIVQRPDQGISGWAIQHGRVVRSNDLKNDARYLEIFPGLQSGLYVPIKIAGRVLGVISIESERPLAFSESDERLTMTLAGQAAIAIENVTLFGSLQRSNADLATAYDATIEGWSRALDLRDEETEGHSLRVTEITMKLARAFGLSQAELVQVRWGALLHDIGKMGVPDGILLKPGPLTKEEWLVMHKHPTFAYELLSPIHYLRLALDIPYCHHEKWDGSGYPRGLKGAQIPLVARIFAVVDVWDALRSDRPYRAAWAKEKVREHICALSGTHFDPQVVETFFQMPY